MIVILEDNDDRQTEMTACLSRWNPKQPVHFFKTAPNTIDCLNTHWDAVELIALDHDLEMIETEGPRTFMDPGTGRDVADFLAAKPPICPVIIHTTNIPAGIGMQMALNETGWKTKRLIPYGDLEWIREMWFPIVKKFVVSTLN